LPYYGVPQGRRFGKELSANDFVCYLRRYAARFDLDVRLATKVKPVPESTCFDIFLWLEMHEQAKAAGGRHASRHLAARGHLRLL
jgi:hypothetical protein